MSANVVLLDAESNAIVDEINFDRTIVGREYIKGYKVKNIGKSNAYNINLVASYLSSAMDDDFEAQKLAATWKTFSFEKEGPYESSLSLGDLEPGKLVEGERSIDCMLSADREEFIERWNTGITEYKDGNLVFVNNTRDGSGVSGRRIAFELGVMRDLEISFNLESEKDDDFTSDFNLQANFCIRMNANKDGKGYVIGVQRRRTDGKVLVGIYKGGVGYSSNNTRDIGELIYRTGFNNYDPKDKITLKVYNNIKKQPCFEALIGRTNLKFSSNDGSETNLSFATDKGAKPYIIGGRFYLDSALWKGDVSYTLKNLSIKTEEYNHIIYIKTAVTDTATANFDYRSAVIINFEEDGEVTDE